MRHVVNSLANASDIFTTAWPNTKGDPPALPCLLIGSFAAKFDGETVGLDPLDQAIQAVPDRLPAGPTGSLRIHPSAKTGNRTVGPLSAWRLWWRFALLRRQVQHVPFGRRQDRIAWLLCEFAAQANRAVRRNRGYRWSCVVEFERCPSAWSA